LAYPFYFMHEYVSHIYTVETGSEFFEDGWLLYAACAFLKQLDARAFLLSLHGRQIDAFERYILSHLRDKAEEGYFKAKGFHGRVERHQPGCFQTLMHDLAVRSPAAGLRHADFLRRLDHHFRNNWDNLRRWLESAGCCVEEVWPWL
jgi:hypothetical protein